MHINLTHDREKYQHLKESDLALGWLVLLPLPQHWSCMSLTRFYNVDFYNHKYFALILIL
jgi:hypothetical protein